MKEALVPQENIKMMVETVPRELFRAYDIRGLVSSALTPKVMKIIARAVATELIRQGEHQVIVARDGRLSSPLLSRVLKEGLMEGGCDVFDIGLVPTPILYFATQVLPITSGIVVTASHNPGDYNGLKIVCGGETLTEKQIESIYEVALRGEFTCGKGSYTCQTIVEEYIAAIRDKVKIGKTLKVVVDCGSGAASEVAPRLFRKLGCEVVPLYCDMNGNFPHHHPDPSNINNMHPLVEAVKKEKAQVGLAFDGDGDRLGVVTDAGTIVWPDRQMMLYAENVLKTNKGATVLFDVKCSQHLPQVIKKAGGEPLMWKTGHALIKKKMRETGALLAGEMSGHIFFKDRWFGFDDALYSGARLLEILSQETMSCEEIFNRFPHSINTPEINVPMADDKKKKFMEAVLAKAEDFGGELITLDGLRVHFSEGWGLIRQSNTTPNLVLRFEANSEEALKAIQTIFRRVLLRVEPDLALPF